MVPGGQAVSREEGGQQIAPDPMAAADAVEALAPSAEDIETARAELEPLLDAAGIDRVVFVDNEFEVLIDELISALRDIPADRRAQVAHLQAGIDFNVPQADEAVWIDQVTERFESLDDWERAITGADALARSGHRDLRDQPNAGAIGPLIPQEMTELLSPHEWDERKAQILDEALARRTLILLDRHFEEGDEAGPRLLREVFDHTNANHLRAGIVTNTVTRAEEQALWKELVDRFGFPPDRFVVISKENWAKGCLSFPQSLKVALLTPRLDDLLKVVSEALTAAHQAAIDGLKAISPYELERLVFAFSQREGVWEPETLLRLANISTRKRALAALRGDLSIHFRVSEARRIASFKTTEVSATTEQAAATARRLQHDEVFEEGDYVNVVHLPLELGDVFRKRTSDTRFILMAQPCDLMVRAGGRRTPEPEFLTLVRIQDSRPDTNPRNWHEISFFNADGSSTFALLNRPSLVPAEALDLCVYNPNGSVELHIEQSSPQRVTPHWDARFERQRKWAASCAAKVLAVEDQNTRALVTRAVFRCSEDSLCRGRITGNNKVVEFNMVRVGRLRQPASLELLGTFLAYQGRMAFEGRLYEE
jgi:hypothetical protein